MDKQTQKHWSDFCTSEAKEEITLEYIKGILYAFGSELATLRIYKTLTAGGYKTTYRQAYSINRKSFYIAIGC